MSKDFCLDCGMLLSPTTSICNVCGFDNDYEEYSNATMDIDRLIDISDKFAPENSPGF